MALAVADMVGFVSLYNGCSASNMLIHEQCGKTAAHCGAGCVSGCITIGTAGITSVELAAVAVAAEGDEPSSLPHREDGRCGTAFGGVACDPDGPVGRCCRYVRESK